MGKWRFVPLLLVLVFLMSMLCGCFEIKTVAIAVLDGDAPTKVAVGQFDWNSVTVTVTMSDRRAKKVTLNTDMFYYKDYVLLRTTPGIHTFTIGYENFTTQCTIEVIGVTSVEVKAGTLKNEYDKYGLKDTTGGVLILHLADDTTCETAITDSMVIGFDSSTTGLKSMTVRYNNDVNLSCSYAYTVASNNGLSYELNASQDGYIVSWDKKTRIDCLVIPSTYHDLPIVQIKTGGFKDCGSLEEVYLPSSVTLIGSDQSVLGAFANCVNLVTFVALGRITVVGNNTFDGCVSLASMQLGDSLIYLGGHAFAGCTSLTAIDLPLTVTTIGAYCFYECSALHNIVVPQSVETIGINTFCASQRVFLNVSGKPSQWADNWQGSCTTYYWSNQWSYVGAIPTPNA
ncbi:MAG: leucine-rich repeat domain-containing protein [Clostridia bacterium]|nr:leucine-rich repeat domain-containing protein [Clostridia bacterium]